MEEERQAEMVSMRELQKIEIQKEREIDRLEEGRRGWGGISIQRQSVVFQAAAAVKIGERKNNDGLKD